MFICFTTHHTDVEVTVEHVMLVMFVGFSVSRIHISGKNLGIATLVFLRAVDVMLPSPKGFHGHGNSERVKDRVGLYNEPTTKVHIIA